MRRSAFTLIELLVVVAIVALLVSILLPSLSAAREQARMTACLSNIDNMAFAVIMYADENRDYFPMSRDHGGFQDGGWINTLEPYAGTKLLYRCPSDRSTNWFNPADPTRTPARENSYAINIYMTPDNVPRSPFDPPPTSEVGYVRRRQVPRSGMTIYLAEYRDTHGSQHPLDHIHADAWLPNFTGQRRDPAEEVAIGRHRGRSENYGYVDGHAESKPFDRTFEFDEARQMVVESQWDPAFRARR